METTDDIVIENPEELYRLLLPYQMKVTVDKVGPMALFFAGMKEFNDPNVCSCKKGKNRKQSLDAVYVSLPSTMKDEHKSYLYNLFGGAMVLKKEGVLLGRLE
jgi:hypothetical protein